MTMSNSSGQQEPGPTRPARRDWRPGARLTRLEQDMRSKAEAGELLALGKGPFELAEMQAWGPRRTIRATVLRHLLVDKEWRVHSKGVQLRGVRISGHLDLEEAALRCPLRLEDCYLDDREAVNLGHAAVPLLSLANCHLSGLIGDALIVTQDLELRGSTFTGPIRLIRAKIAGRLSCPGARLTGVDRDGHALIADGIRVSGDVLLEGFSAAGAIRLVGADITGQLACSGAQLQADADGNALVADGLKVAGGVFLDSASNQGTFTAAGTVRLADADIKGQLSMGGAQLIPAGKDGNALAAGRLKVAGDVLLGSAPDQGAFTAAGAVSLPDARVGGSLYLTGADLAAEAGKAALNAEGIQITRKLVWQPAKPVLGRVNLEGGTAAELEDDWTGSRFEQNGYWPADLRLDGFTYTTIGAGNNAGVGQRLEWIGSQPMATWGGTVVPAIRAPWRESRIRRARVHARASYGFASQPYEQLARVYRRAGQDTEANIAAIAMRRDFRRYGDLMWYRRASNWLLDVMIGYGYRPLRALLLLFAVYLLWVLFFWYLQDYTNVIVPAQSTAGLPLVPSAQHCTSVYPCFYPAGYAIDTVIPIINVHQIEYWRLRSNGPWGPVIESVSWLGAGLGWAIALFAGGWAAKAAASIGGSAGGT